MSSVEKEKLPLTINEMRNQRFTLEERLKPLTEDDWCRGIYDNYLLNPLGADCLAYLLKRNGKSTEIPHWDTGEPTGVTVEEYAGLLRKAPTMMMPDHYVKTINQEVENAIKAKFYAVVTKDLIDNYEAYWGNFVYFEMAEREYPSIYDNFWFLYRGFFRGDNKLEELKEHDNFLAQLPEEQLAEYEYESLHFRILNMGDELAKKVEAVVHYYVVRQELLKGDEEIGRARDLFTVATREQIQQVFLLELSYTDDNRAEIETAFLPLLEFKGIEDTDDTPAGTYNDAVAGKDNAVVRWREDLSNTTEEDPFNYGIAFFSKWKANHWIVGSIDEARVAAEARNNKLRGTTVEALCKYYGEELSDALMGSMSFNWAEDYRLAALNEEHMLIEEEVAEEMKGCTQDEFEREVLRRKGLNNEEIDQEMDWHYYLKRVEAVAGLSEEEMDQELFDEIDQEIEKERTATPQRLESTRRKNSSRNYPFTFKYYPFTRHKH